MSETSDSWKLVQERQISWEAAKFFKGMGVGSDVEVGKARQAYAEAVGRWMEVKKNQSARLYVMVLIELGVTVTTVGVMVLGQVK